MSILSYIVWDANPDIFSLFGKITVRWYGLLFALGFLISQQVLFYIFRKEGKPEKDVETLTIYMVIATVIGARLGHVLFYEPEKYLANPIDIIKIWEGGLASHGATIAILIALYLYSRKKKDQSYLWVLDKLVIVVALTGGLIRLGNFMNSEIIGEPTNSDFGVVFARDVEVGIQNSTTAVESVETTKLDDNATTGLEGKVPVGIEIKFKNENYNETSIKNYLEDEVKGILTEREYVTEHIYEPVQKPLEYKISKQPKEGFTAEVKTLGIARHPAQLYESISCFILFIFLFLFWNRKKGANKEGLIFGLFLIILFSLRFLYEFLKEPQVEFERNMTLNMGQILSIPLIIAGVIILIKVLKNPTISIQGTGSNPLPPQG